MNDLFLVLGLLSFSNRSACRVVSCRQTCRPTSTSHGHPLVVGCGAGRSWRVLRAAGLVQTQFDL
jgi:hypothetical protein